MATSLSAGTFLKVLLPPVRMAILVIDTFSHDGDVDGRDTLPDRCHQAEGETGAHVDLEKVLLPKIERFEGKVSDSELAALKEAIEIEDDRRENQDISEDALDQDCIPFEDWERFPGQMQNVDIPTTPRDRAVYMGNTRQRFYDEFPEPDSDTLVITYGVTARSAKEAVTEMKKRGHPVSLLILKTLWPVPEGLIKSRIKGYSRIVVFEMNMGQYVREIERLLPGSRIDFYGQMNGELIAPWEVEEVLSHD